MDIYSDISKIYDLSLEKDFYKKYYSLIKKIIYNHNLNIQNVLELGTGTGNMTKVLLDCGYEVVGVDKSIEMLQIAQDKTFDYGNKIILLNQDIIDIDIDIYEIDMILLCLDVVNYLYDAEDIESLIAFSYDHLKKGGLLLFDYSSLLKFENLLDDKVYSEDLGSHYYVWSSYLDNEDNTANMYVDIFEKIDRSTYVRYEENQVQKTYDPNEILDISNKYNFTHVDYFYDFDMDKKDEGYRVFFSVIK